MSERKTILCRCPGTSAGAPSVNAALHLYDYSFITEEVTNARALTGTVMQLITTINWPALNQSQRTNFLSRVIIN